MPYVKNLFCPSGITAFLFIAGVMLLVSKRARKAGKWLLTAAGIIYVIFGTGPVSFWLLGSLEYCYPPIVSFKNFKNVKSIVVLAGYAERDPSRPISSEVNPASAFRTIESERIFRQIPASRIIISGYQDVPVIMKELAVSLGLPSHMLVIDSKSGNTYESAVNLKSMIGSERFFLITSAGHMPRAMSVFKKQGMAPIPAPTDFRSRKNFWAIDYLPSPRHLEYSDLAVHEYIGMLWYKINDRI